MMTTKYFMQHPEAGVLFGVDSLLLVPVFSGSCGGLNCAMPFVILVAGGMRDIIS